MWVATHGLGMRSEEEIREKAEAFGNLAEAEGEDGMFGAMQMALIWALEEDSGGLP